MVNKNTLGLPEYCSGCTPPSCRELLLSLSDSFIVTEIDGELHAYPPNEQSFQSRCTAAISKLAICRERSNQQPYISGNPELAL